MYTSGATKPVLRRLPKFYHLIIPCVATHYFLCRRYTENSLLCTTNDVAVSDSYGKVESTSWSCWTRVHIVKTNGQGRQNHGSSRSTAIALPCMWNIWLWFECFLGNPRRKLFIIKWDLELTWQLPLSKFCYKQTNKQGLFFHLSPSKGIIIKWSWAFHYYP